LQQKPSTQLPDAHSLPLLQAVPLPGSGWQTPFLQVWPSAHCESAVQDNLHVTDPGSHAYGRQSVETARQFPAPSHARSTMYSLRQEGSPQTLPDGNPVQPPAPSQVPAQVALLPRQSPRGSVFASASVQVPGVASHCSQAPLHRVEQQMPSAQNPLAHSPSSEQELPTAERPTHWPPLQLAPAAQWLLLVQLVRQPFAWLLHAYGLQETVPTSQVPKPSHVCPLSTALVHVLAPQLLVGYSHAPAPLQTPPHAPPPGHSLSGSVPSGIEMQVPALEPLHFSQVPRQERSQQTPSVQKPDWHCDPVLQALPFGASSTHWLFTQIAPDTHWKLPLQLLRQVAP
jgi:hypothetical protein